MVKLSPQLLIATATAFIGLGEYLGGEAPQVLIDHMRDQVGETGHGEWDAALVHYCGYWSHYDHRSERSTWPVIAAATANDLAQFGAARKVLRDTPLEGDIFLQYAPLDRRFVRAGIIVQIVAQRWFPDASPVFDVLTVEGNTGKCGELGGTRTRRIARKASIADGDRFLRWVELAPLASRRGEALKRTTVDVSWHPRII